LEVIIEAMVTFSYQFLLGSAYPFFLVGFFIFLIALIVVVVVMAFMWKKWMNDALGRMCQRHGYIFYGDNIANVRYMIQGTALDLGHSKRASYGIGWRHQGIDLTMFQWQYTVGSGKNSHTYFFKVAMMPADFNARGYIFLRKERFFDKIGGVFGFNDLDFEDQEFSDKFYVKAQPQRFGYDFFNPKMMELFLRYGAYSLVVKDNTIMMYTTGGLGSLGSLSALRRGENPFASWMGSAGTMLMEIKKRIPRIMLRRRRRKTEEVRVAEEVDVPVFKEDSPVLVACPSCSIQFEIGQDAKDIMCPACGAKGELT